MGFRLSNTLNLPLLFCFPFSGGYIVSAQPVDRLHWTPAAWPPGSHHDRTSTGEQTMTFQDAPPRDWATFTYLLGVIEMHLLLFGDEMTGILQCNILFCLDA